jgi:hypothetical protein
VQLVVLVVLFVRRRLVVFVGLFVRRLRSVLRRVLRRSLHDDVRLGPDDGRLHYEVQRRLHRGLHRAGERELPGKLSGEQLCHLQERARE